jgi:hypothetical protein
MQSGNVVKDKINEGAAEEHYFINHCSKLSFNTLNNDTKYR